MANKHVTVTRQAVELRMQQIGAVAPAKISCRVGNCYEYRVIPGFVPDEKSIAIRAAVGRGAKVDNERAVKLIREARVSRQAALPQLTGLAARNLHNPGLVVVRIY